MSDAEPRLILGDFVGGPMIGIYLIVGLGGFMLNEPAWGGIALFLATVNGVVRQVEIDPARDVLIVSRRLLGVPLWRSRYALHRAGPLLIEPAGAGIFVWTAGDSRYGYSLSVVIRNRRIGLSQAASMVSARREARRLARWFPEHTKIEVRHYRKAWRVD